MTASNKWCVIFCCSFVTLLLLNGSTCDASRKTPNRANYRHKINKFSEYREPTNGSITNREKAAETIALTNVNRTNNRVPSQVFTTHLAVTEMFDSTTVRNGIPKPMDRPFPIETNDTEVTTVMETEEPSTTKVHNTEVTTESEVEETTTTTTTIMMTTTELTTTEAVVNENVTTTTTTIQPSNNETTQTLNDTDHKGQPILKAETIANIYRYYKAITPIILRILFGIVMEMRKVKATLKKPIGIGIAFACNFLFMPLSSYAFGWIFSTDNSQQRLSLYLSGATSTRLMGVFSNCWTMVLGGNIELSIVMSVVIIICSSIIHSKWLFDLAEYLFNRNSSNSHIEFELNGFSITWTVCATLIPLLIGFLIQTYCLPTKKYAAILIRRAVFSYILFNVVAMAGYSVVNWLHSDTLLHFHLLEFALPKLRYLTGFFIAMLFQQQYADCITIAVECTIPRQNASTSLPMIAHYILDKFRRTQKDEKQTENTHAQTTYHSCPDEIPRVLRVNDIFE